MELSVTKMINKAELETVCGITSKFPENHLPEFAFAGKSNVGKSSLINSLMQRKSLARTSASPGKTQTINYYKVENSLYFVDLPGYGYTKVSESVKAGWGKMVERYLKQSSMLLKVFLLVDIRHKPTADDRLMYSWIEEQGFEPVVLATKADKLGKNDKPKALKLIRETLSMKQEDALIAYSAETGEGREQVYSLLNDLMEKAAAAGNV